jgi:hypothetical protein
VLVIAWLKKFGNKDILKITDFFFRFDKLKRYGAESNTNEAVRLNYYLIVILIN